MTVDLVGARLCVLRTRQSSPKAILHLKSSSAILKSGMVGVPTQHQHPIQPIQAVPLTAAGCNGSAGAFGDIGIISRKLEWKKPMLFDRMLQKAPNASRAPQTMKGLLARTSARCSSNFGRVFAM